MTFEQPKFEIWEKEKMERCGGIIKTLKGLERKELSEETRKELDKAELRDVLEMFKIEEGKFYSNLSEEAKKAVKEALGKKVKELVGLSESEYMNLPEIAKEIIGDCLIEKAKTKEGLERMKKEAGWLGAEELSEERKSKSFSAKCPWLEKLPKENKEI